MITAGQSPEVIVGGVSAESPLTQFNAATEDQAVTQLLRLCASKTWAEVITARRPLASIQSLTEAAADAWFSLLEPDWLEAFAAHPRIGEKKAPTTRYLASSETEQSAAQQTLEPVAQALLLGNRAYEDKFGFRYIVFASGRTAPELLAVLESRLQNSRAEELQEAARQQHRITTLRMAKWLNPEGTP